MGYEAKGKSIAVIFAEINRMTIPSIKLHMIVCAGQELNARLNRKTIAFSKAKRTARAVELLRKEYVATRALVA